jgi:hypothetical protein
MYISLNFSTQITVPRVLLSYKEKNLRHQFVVLTLNYIIIIMIERIYFKYIYHIHNWYVRILYNHGIIFLVS